MNKLKEMKIKIVMKAEKVSRARALEIIAERGQKVSKPKCRRSPKPDAIPLSEFLAQEDEMTTDEIIENIFAKD